MFSKISFPTKLLKHALKCTTSMKWSRSSHGMMSGLVEGTKYVRRDSKIFEISPEDDKDIDIELLLSPTPNGHKVSILLEELGVPYRVHCINLNGEQFSKEFKEHIDESRICATSFESNIPGT